MEWFDFGGLDIALLCPAAVYGGGLLLGCCMHRLSQSYLVRIPLLRFWFDPVCLSVRVALMGRRFGWLDVWIPGGFQLGTRAQAGGVMRFLDWIG